MSKEIFPKIGDVLKLENENYVLFAIDANIPAYEDDKPFFKMAYYFIKESDISDPHMSEKELGKKSIAINKRRDEGFDIDCKVDTKYSVKECTSLIFRKVRRKI